MKTDKERDDRQNVQQPETPDKPDETTASDVIGDTVEKVGETTDKAVDTDTDKEQEKSTGDIKVEQLQNIVMRLQADIENIRKRHEKELSSAHKYGQEKLMRELLPVLDSFEMGISSIDEKDADKALLDGIKLTSKMLSDALHKHSLTSIEPHGEMFDPDKHEAMTIIPSQDAEENTIVEVIQKGYALSDRLLRPARVIVAGKLNK